MYMYMYMYMYIYMVVQAVVCLTKKEIRICQRGNLIMIGTTSPGAF